MPFERTLGLGEPKIRFPADQVTAQVGDHLVHAAADHTSREFAHAILHLLDCLRRDAETYFLPLQPEEREAEKLPARGLIDGTLRFVDPEPESPEEAPERLEHALTGAPRPHVNIAVVGVSRELVPTLLQFFVNVVEEDVGE